MKLKLLKFKKILFIGVLLGGFSISLISCKVGNGQEDNFNHLEINKEFKGQKFEEQTAFSVQFPDGWKEKVEKILKTGEYNKNNNSSTFEANYTSWKVSYDYLKNNYMSLKTTDGNGNNLYNWKSNVNFDISYTLKKNSDNSNNVFYVCEINNIKMKNEEEFMKWLSGKSNFSNRFFNNNETVYLNTSSKIILNKPSMESPYYKLLPPKKYNENGSYYNYSDPDYLNKREQKMKAARALDGLTRLNDELGYYNERNLRKSNFALALLKNSYFKNNSISFKEEIKDYLEKNVTNLTKVVFKDEDKTIYKFNLNDKNIQIENYKY